jgi:hypothetical protein
VDPVSECCSPPQRDEAASTCPRCGTAGRTAGSDTLAAILRPEAAARFASAGARFCATKTCGVVYYSADGRLAEKGDAVIRIGAKETDAPIPLCYCFGFTREDVYRDVAASGTSAVPERIEAEVRAGRCSCRTKNPSGRCCLGEVRRAVTETRAAMKRKVE